MEVTNGKLSIASFNNCPHSVSDKCSKKPTLLHLPSPLQLPPRVSLRFSRVGYQKDVSSMYGFNDSQGYVTESPYMALEGEAYPRPAEIPWSKELSNSVQLIGVVGASVEVKHLTSGKVLAWTRLAVKKSATETFWIGLSFWDEMAHIAHRHLAKGNQIYVNGRLASDVVESQDGKAQTYFKVVVQQFNFIERSSALPTNDRAARKFRTAYGDQTGSIEESWQAFFANPSEWWDNRKTKRNPNYPDFKHKDTGEALWVEGRNNPPWIKLQLSKLDDKMRPGEDSDAQWPPFSLYSDKSTLL